MVDVSSISFDDMSVVDLKALQARIEKAISTYEERKRQEALTKLEDAAKEMGFSLAELTGGKAPKAKTVGVPKYANPDNPSQTWTGKGRRPDWFIAAVEAGIAPETLEI